MLDRNEITVNLPKQTRRGPGQMLVISRVCSNKMLHLNNEEQSHLNSTGIFSNSVAITSHKSMFWYLKKQKPKNHKPTTHKTANDEKSELYAGHPYARVCLIWLTINQRTHFATRTVQSGFGTSKACSNELGLQCKLKCDALKGRG